MKKYVFFCLLALSSIMLTSCQSNEPQFHKRTIDLAVSQSQWDYDASVGQYFCHFDLPELTEQIYNYGEISVSHEYNSGSKNAYQVALPETQYVAIDLENEDGTTSPYYYQQHLDYAYGIGFVEVFLTISDFYYEGFTPGAMMFRLQMTY